MDERSQPSDWDLEKLKDSGLQLADPRQDLRGRHVFDQAGADIGHVDALFVDKGERKIRILDIGVGGLLGLGERHVLLPVDAITKVTDSKITVNQTRHHVLKSPIYEPALVERATKNFWSSYYFYYGFPPFWGSGYIYPSFGFAP